MLKSQHRVVSRFVALVLALSLAITPLSSALAQVNDIEPPVLIHRQLDSGVAGELQTFLARVSDDFGVSEVVLYYRQRDSGAFLSLNMRPLVDSIDEYQIAVETSVNGHQGLEYYIEAFDMADNKTNRGFDFAPIVMALTAPVPAISTTGTPSGPVATPEPEPAPQSEGFKFNPFVVLAGVGALLALGAVVAAGGGSDDEAPTTNEIPDTPTPTPDTVTLTIIGDQPVVP